MIFTIESDQLRAEIHPRGAALASLIFKPLGREMTLNISEEARREAGHYAGVIIGPIANRIAGGRFELAGRTHQLDQNEGTNTLHGGREGLSEVEWEVLLAERHRVSLTTTLLGGQSGFPFACRFEANYEIAGNALTLRLWAKAEVDCAINLAPHFYLAAPNGARIDEFDMQIQAAHYLPVDDALIPTGEIAPVEETRFDFRVLRPIGGALIDHNFCLDDSEALTIKGRDFHMDLHTNQKGLQIYTGDHLERKAIAIEPQGWPNAVNEPNFPSAWIGAGEAYENVSKFRFECE